MFNLVKENGQKRSSFTKVLPADDVCKTRKVFSKCNMKHMEHGT